MSTDCEISAARDGVYIACMLPLQTCTRTGKRGVMSVLDTDVLESTGNILEVVVTLVDSTTTG